MTLLLDPDVTAAMKQLRTQPATSDQGQLRPRPTHRELWELFDAYSDLYGEEKVMLSGSFIAAVEKLLGGVLPAPPAEALAARPLLEQVARMGDCIGQHTVGEILAISDRAAAWLRENPPGQPIDIEPRGCPIPGACACVEPVQPEPEGPTDEVMMAAHQRGGAAMTAPTKYQATTTTVVIHPEGLSFDLAEQALTLELTDEGAGSFFLLSQDGGVPLRIESAELELLVVEARKLLAQPGTEAGKLP